MSPYAISRNASARLSSRRRRRAQRSIAPSLRLASTSLCRSAASRSRRFSMSSSAKSAGGLAGGTGGRYFGYVTGGRAACGGDRRGVDGRGRPERRHVAARAGGCRAGARNDSLARRSSRVPGRSRATSARARRWRTRSPSRSPGTGSAGSTASRSLQQGVRALPELAVYGIEELHLSDHKALRTLGLGSGCVRTIPIDDRYAMRVDLLAEAIRRDRDAGVEPAIVIAQAGSVNTGACDSARGDRRRLRGARPLASRRRRVRRVLPALGAGGEARVAGMERADSLAVDAHKWLNVPNGVGLRPLQGRGELHRETFAGSAGVPHARRRSEPARARHRGQPLVARRLRLGGPEAARAATASSRWSRAAASSRRSSPRSSRRRRALELTAPAPTNVVCFRYRPAGWTDGADLDELNRRIQAEVASPGDVFHTGAQLANGFCQRAAFVSWRTDSEDVHALVDAIERAGARRLSS